MRRHLFIFFILNIIYNHVDSAGIRCNPPWFKCDNKCISPSFICDGEADCIDLADEKDCRDFKPIPFGIQCATDEFQCEDRSCIPSAKFCDATPDCPDKSDEYTSCVKNLKCDTFRCKDGYCVRNEWVCDGVPDCPDSSDEKICANRSVPVEECNHEFDRYLCKNQRCISLNVTCNEKDDCGDGSDENILECKKADTSCKQIAKCEHLCRRTPQGARCSCRSGYKLLNNRTCADINECDNFGVCDQLCFNSPGSHECSCHHSYSLNSDMRTCKAEGGEGSMVFSIKSEIRGLYLDSEHTEYYPVVRDLQHAVAVSLDANYVYWSDIQNGNEAIIRSLVDGSQKEVIVTSGLNSPDDIAVDWVTDNIYFTDSEFMHIGVCNSNGSYCTIVIKERTGKPRGLALLPGNGIMYWAEWSSNSHISKSSMDGKNTSRVVVENLEWPSSLSIDYVNNRLYWIDSKLKLIETVRLDGSDRRTVLKDIAKMPFSLAVFENKLYWSDRASKTIQSCDKFTGKDWKILLTLKSNVYGIHIYHSVLKPKISNPCNVNSCSQLCLLNSKNGYTCACTLDKELNSDQRTCRAVKKQMHLIVAAGDRFIDYYHELLGKPKMTMSVTLKHATAVTYNPLTDRLLVNDQLTDDIYNFNVNTGKLKAIIRTKDKVLGGMDFDYIGNNLYLSDISHKIIEVHSLSTHEKTVFYFQEEPHAIALVPEEGVMFVVFHSSGKYRIDLMKMHGIGPRIPVEGIKTPLRGPTIALCYDRDSERLFWSDQSTGRIGSTTIKGFVTHIFRTGLSEPVSLAVFDDYVFWTQYKSDQLHWTSKDNTQQYQKSITLEVEKDLERLRLVSLRRAYVNKHECHVNNGNCSHVCLVNNLQSRICACPPDMMLFGNNYTCTPQTACKPDEMKCGEHDMCIKLHQRCDGRQDCPNGEDESSVCDEFRLSKCEKGAQFQCKSGECINITSRCNFHYDCPDGDQSDEEDCDEKKCNTYEFQCHEGTCVSKYAVCDGNYDCSDFSDEKDCSKHVCDINSFTCENGMCIPKTWKCDGEMDCSDGSDEDETCHKTPCPSEMFTCDNGRCIDMSLKCNAANDCEDGSDEYYCTGKNSNNIVYCTADEYKCYNSDICIPKEAKCNGVSECPKHDDEHNCVRCQKGQFACYNQNCIDESWVCDQTDDCGDGSDETNCDGSNPRKTIANSNCKEFRCSDGMCLPFEKVCDTIPDCSDQSDEFGKCALSCTMDYPCSTVCHKTPQGPVCDCPIGYQLDNDLKTCKDVNECEHSVCSQICHNNDGSFTCSCYEGYVLRNDKTSCKVAGPQMEIISVTGNTIRKLSANLRSIEIVYEELSEISSIDVNANENTIYWSNDMLGMISKIHINSKIRKTVTGIGRPRALAVDWSTDNVYFTNTEYLGSIKVCNLEEQKCAKLVTIEPRSKAMSIAVHPKQGWLFWSQTNLVLYDKPTSKIYRSDLAGSNVKAIVYHNIGIVSAMVIDHTRSRLYWSDTFLKTIESSNFDGSDRVIYLKTDVYQVLSINIYEDNLYLLLGATATLKKCKLYHDKSCTVFSLDHFNVDKYFTILHTSRQPTVKNTCKNHKCEYMCVLGKNTSTCICHNGRMENLKTTCEQNMNVKLKFDSSVANRKGEQIHHKNGLLIGVLVACIIIIIIMFGYYYYQKIKPNIFKKSSVSIYFQNSTYDEQGKFATSFNSLSTLPPGEHEYVNPVISLSKKQDNKLIEKDKNQLVNIGHSDHSDAESEASTYKQNSRLIN